MCHAIISLLLILVSAVSSKSQVLETPSKTYDVNKAKQDTTHPETLSPNSDCFPKVKIGIKAGLNLSNLNFNKGFPKPTVPVESVWGIGFGGGFILEAPLHKKLYLQQEYLYTHINGEVESEGYQYTLKYVSLPTLLKLMFLPKISLVAGPQFDLLLHAVENHDSSSLNIIHETEERNIGAVAGIEYKPSDNVAIDARFMHGINHISIKQNNYIKEFKLQAIQLSIYFNI